MTNTADTFADLLAATGFAYNLIDVDGSSVQIEVPTGGAARDWMDFLTDDDGATWAANAKQEPRGNSGQWVVTFDVKTTA